MILNGTRGIGSETKEYLVPVIFFFYFPSSICACEISGKGVKAGINFAKLSKILNTEFRSGFVGGAFITFAEYPD